jgi:hypothetical protein
MVHGNASRRMKGNRMDKSKNGADAFKDIPSGVDRRLALAALVVALQAGCSRPKETHAASTDAGAVTVAAGAASGEVASATNSTPPVPYGMALAERLRLEAAGRPSDTPKAEDVLAAVTKAGVPLDAQAQHLASPIGARFCIGAKSPQNVAMSACEYADDAAAAAGRDASVKAFAKIEHRDILLNKRTTLTILQAPFDAQSQAAHDKAVAAFKKM